MEPYIVIPKPAVASCSWWVGTSRQEFTDAAKREAARMRASQLTASADLGITTRLAYKHREQGEK